MMDKDHKYTNKQEVSYNEEGKKMKRLSWLSSDEADAEMKIDEVSVEDKAAEARHVCNICGKSFNNGKALGGHRRSHFQAAKKKVKKTPNFSNIIIHTKEGTTISSGGGISNSKKANNCCYVCKKKFPTKNALYGHMRSHPDRVCKGVSPPTTHPSHHQHNSNSCKEDHQDYYDLSRSNLPRWKRTGKRGRKCSQSYEACYEAAINLMYLGAQYFCAAVSIKKEKDATTSITTTNAEPKSPDEVPKPRMNKKRKIGESSNHGKEHVMNKIKFVFSGSLKLGRKTDEGDCGSDEKISVNMDVKKEKPLGEETSQSAAPKKLDFDLNMPYVTKD